MKSLHLTVDARGARRLARFVAAAAMLGAGLAPAGALTYDYTGNAWNRCDPNGCLSDGDFTPGRNLTATVTFDSLVTRSFSGTVHMGDVLKWSIKTGDDVASSRDKKWTASGDFVFEKGAVKLWSFTVGADWSPLGYGLFLGTQDMASPALQLDTASEGVGDNRLASSVFGDPGEWAVRPSAAVPEPSSMALLGAGALGLRMLRRRRA